MLILAPKLLKQPLSQLGINWELKKKVMNVLNPLNLLEKLDDEAEPPIREV